MNQCRSRLGLILGLFFAGYLATGCAKDAANLVFSLDPSNPSQIQSAPFNFGDVAVTKSKTQYIIVTNVGTKPAALNDVSNGANGLSAPFTSESFAEDQVWNGFTPCRVGLPMEAKGGRCYVAVTVAPSDPGYFEQQLQISFTEIDTMNVGTAKLQLLLRGILDCSVNPDWQARFNDGVAAANEQMVRDAEQGRRDGEALTYADGVSDGRQQRYQEGYNTGYNSTQGYTAGYTEGHRQGEIDAGGPNSYASCSNGTDRGFTDGLTDGRVHGDYDGYGDGAFDGEILGRTDGYDFGFDDGYINGTNDGFAQGTADANQEGFDLGYEQGRSDGYSYGYSDGTDACFGGAPKIKGASQSHTDFLGGCYQQGFDRTYLTSAYTQAYEQAKAQNEEYKNGVENGKAQGFNEGVLAGQSQGYNDGYEVGRHEGFLDRTEADFQNCYNAAYPQAYSQGYNQSYDSGYDRGLNDGYDTGYAATYDGGYNDGYHIAYDPNYTSAYSAAYTSAYEAGYDQGLDIGYNDGYDDGYYASCGGAPKIKGNETLKASVMISKALIAKMKLKSELLHLMKSSVLRTATPKPKIPMTKVPPLKPVAKNKAKAQLRVLRPVIQDESSDYLKQLEEIRDEKNPGSLRSFLRMRARATR